MTEKDSLVARLTIAHLQAAHVERQEEWCPDQKPDLSFRGNEMAGEVGEACNVIKKLERERHGWRGSRATKEQLAEELADVVHTAVLCAITAGIDLEPAVIDKFNATSEKNGLASRLEAGEPPQPVADAGDVARATLYAENLAIVLHNKHYATDAPQWKPLSGDLAGILTQIDNMTSGLVRADALTRQSEQIASLTKERDGLRTYAHEATKAITGLTAGGSEYFGRRIGEMYTADLPFCVERIRERFEREAEWSRKAVAEKRAAESRLAELEQETVKVVSSLNSHPNNHEAQNAARALLDKLRRPS